MFYEKLTVYWIQRKTKTIYDISKKTYLQSEFGLNGYKKAYVNNDKLI